jgi:hypothetical protein
MRNIKMGLITLAASAAILIPAAGATASTQQDTSTAASSSLTCVVLCFDLYVDDVLSGNDVEISPTVEFCGIQAVQLQALAVGQTIDCADGHKKVKRSK